MSRRCRTDRTTGKSRTRNATEFHLCVEIHSEIRILDIRAKKDLRTEIPAEIAPLQDNHVHLRDHHLNLHHLDAHQSQLEVLDTIAVARLHGVNVRREDSALRILRDAEPGAGAEPITGQPREHFGLTLAGIRAETCLTCQNHRRHHR